VCLGGRRGTVCSFAWLGRLLVLHVRHSILGGVWRAFTSSGTQFHMFRHISHSSLSSDFAIRFRSGMGPRSRKRSGDDMLFTSVSDGMNPLLSVFLSSGSLIVLFGIWHLLYCTTVLLILAALAGWLIDEDVKV